jgi:hypothetical protein
MRWASRINGANSKVSDSKNPVGILKVILSVFMVPGIIIYLFSGALLKPSGLGEEGGNQKLLAESQD